MEDRGSFVDWESLQQQLVQAREANLDKTFLPWVVSVGGTIEAARWLGLGYRTEKKAITWPERDSEGNIVGIGCRDIRTGRKYMVESSKHGIIYCPDANWGGVVDDPGHPVVIVEGMTDVMACATREIYAIGKPSATGTVEANAYLEQAVKGKKIALIAENDKGIGAIAFLSFARPLAKKAAGVWAIYPPQHCKDIREWIKAEGDDAVATIEDHILYRRPWSDDPDIIAVSLDLLEDTAPMRIAEQFIKEKHIVMGASTLRYWNSLWHAYHGDHFFELKMDYVRSEVYQWLDAKKIMVKEGKGENAEWIEQPYRPDTRKVNLVIDALKAIPQVIVPPDTIMPSWLDGGIGRPRPQDLIAFANGLLDVKAYVESGNLNFIPPTPMWFSQSYCPYDFDPKAIHLAKPFLDYLEEIFNGDRESIDLLQEWLFYIMTSDTRFEKFMLFVGRPSAGKGTVLDVMAKVVGEANVFQTRIDDVGTRFGLYGALGKTNLFIPDAHVSNIEKGTASLEVVKTVVGRGAINMEGKGLNAISLVLPLRFTISVNELPNFQDTAAALRRRLLILWFPNSYEGKIDPDLKEKLTQPDVIQGVAAWAMLTAKRLYDRKKFTEPKVSRGIAREFERTNTPVSAFIMEECRLGEECQCEKKTLYAVWVDWCRARGVSPGSTISFGQRLIACMPNVRSGKTPRKSNGRREPVYTGIRPRSNFDPDPED